MKHRIADKFIRSKTKHNYDKQMKKSLLLIGILVLIIVASLMAIPSRAEASNMNLQEMKTSDDNKPIIKYCCPQCDYCSTKAEICPTHNRVLIKDGMCYCDYCKSKSDKECTCSKCGVKMKKMECKPIIDKTDTTKKSKKQ